MQTIKCVTVGDGTVGKTSMLIAYATDDFPQEYVPTIVEHYTAIVMVDNRPVKIELWDTAGQEEYESMRTLSYPFTDVFLICYSIVDPTTYSNAKDKWKPEVTSHRPSAIIILVGMKLDLREDETTIKNLKLKGKRPITYNEGKSLAESIGAYKYLECSALTKDGLKDVFDNVFLAMLSRNPKWQQARNTCSIL